MASLNRVELIGTLGQDPELRYTPTRVPVVTLNIATTAYVTTKDGEKQEKTEWHRVIVWNKQAENCAEYLSKGRQVYVDGRLQTRSWQDKNGATHYTTEIVAGRVQFLGGGKHESTHQQQLEESASDQAIEEASQRKGTRKRKTRPPVDVAPSIAAKALSSPSDASFQEPF